MRENTAAVIAGLSGAPAAVNNDTADAASAARGDTLAFERIYRRHATRLHTLARRFVGPDLADDALQDVFVHAWERVGQFRGESQFGTWLHRLAVNALIRHADIARRIASRSSATDTDSIAGRTPSPDAHIDVDNALARLGDDVRAVVVLHDIEGYTHQEIAETLGLSISASKMRLHRGRMQLREWLAR